MSPLLDFKAGLSELKNVSAIHIVAVRNEVKELLWLLETNPSEEITITAINFQKNKKQVFTSSLSKATTDAPLSLPQDYIFEPNAAVMKSGLFAEVAMATGTKKLHFNSHLYTSNEPGDFPGRTFKLIETLPYNRKALKKRDDLKKANIATRNFPKSVEAIRKELKIEDGGNSYLFFTTNMKNEKIVLICEKI
ncbi:THUMP-like domain-containing protein [Antarcticibacterium sp. 1MA-6-2]|uniref:THUMP-like domain-containing protein n=1 Tax=Antarcticibacterium sp. 1MA-6-2 TaxID=2908210 RepID=UPI0028833F28|nr:hypothetical protein [Antarcticibacterium sp. 1MA-6-2]